MQIRNLFHAVRPFISAVAVIFTAAVLVFAIYYTQLGLQWATFLAGVLMAAILAEAARVSRSEWITMRRTAQLALVKDKLEHEKILRKRADDTISASKSRLHLIDELLPTMIALVDIEGYLQYHNRALMDWLHIQPEKIRGKHMSEVLGADVYQESATAIRQSLDGHPIRYERIQKMPDGAIYRLFVEHIPQFGEDGKVTGFYMLMNDITSPGDVRPSVRIEPGTTAHRIVETETVAFHDENTSQDLFIDALSEQVSSQKDARQIMSAIENDKFCLFCQQIIPIAIDANEVEYNEILVRLIEEEENMMPPGAFFPLIEKYGLMLNLDRWVVQHVAEWFTHQIPSDKNQKNTIFFINVSSLTIADPGFPEFLKLTLLEHGISGAALCFEIPDTELFLSASVVAEFARQVKRCGCLVAISGFGRDGISFDRIRGFRVDFLKIDGNIVFNILRNPVDLAKLTAINRVAKNIGVKTIAELVESEATIAKLKEIGIDFAQGFEVSKPRPLAG